MFARLHVAMRDALLVRERESLGRRLEDAERLLRRARRDPRCRLCFEDLLERAALEPLEDHVRELAPVGRPQGADVTRLADRGGPLREVREEAAFLDEALDELLASIGRKIAERAEDLDRDGPVPDRMPRAIDQGEATFANDPLDLVLLRDRRADE